MEKKLNNESVVNSYIFMGCKHCGKSTQGKKIAEYINADFYDLDTEIEKKCAMSVRDYYKKYGKEAFIEKEVEAIEELSYLFDEPKKAIVIATGGGICDNDEAIAVIQAIRISLCGNDKYKLSLVYLDLDINYSIDRIMENIKIDNGKFIGVPSYVKNDKGEDPSSLEEIRSILYNVFSERSKKYNHYADIKVEIKNAPIDDNFNTILGALDL